MRWTPNGVPTATDSATFNKPGDYTVFFSNVFQELNSMAVSAGTVTFERLVSPATLSVTNTSGNASFSISNATLNLGSTLPVNLTVGNIALVNGGGTLNVRAGSNLTSYDLTVSPGAAFTVASGSSFTQGRFVQVDGGSFTRAIGSTWTTPANGAFTAKNNAQANFGDTVSMDGTAFTLTSGADVTATGAINLGDSFGSHTTLLVDGVGTSLTAGGASRWSGLSLAFVIRNGATVNLGDLKLFGTSDPSSLNIESTPSVSTTVTAGNIELQMANASGNVMQLNVGNGLGQSTLAQTGASGLIIGQGGPISTGVFQVTDAGSYIGGTGGVTIYRSGTVNIVGGTFSTGGTIFNDGGVFNFTAGSLSYVGNLAVTNGGLLGANVVLNADRKLALTGTTTVDATRSLTLNGSTFNTGALVVNGTFAFNSGTLGITGASGLTIGSGGPLGSVFSLGTGRNLNVTQAMTVATGSRFTIDAGAGFTAGSVNNQGEFALNGSASAATATTFSNAGLLRGTGRLTAAVTNLASGVVRASAGEQLKLDGASFVNQGFVEAIGGSAAPAEVQFGGPASNTTANGLIVGANSLLRFAGGLTNQASLAFSAGDNHVLGDVTNTAAGKIIVTGGAGATFYDDIVQNGVFRVSKIGSTTSTAVVLGSFSGSGGSTGGGDIFFEGDLRPGNSAATVTFDNNVAFGEGTELQIELAGVIAGAQYDQVHVTGDLSIAGTLAVMLAGFTPAAGQSFDILDWGSLSGTFESISLPALPGLAWDTSRLYSTGVLAVVTPGFQAADFDDDGDVDGADLTRWRDNFSTGTSHAQGDADADGDADGADFLVWQRQFNGTSAASATKSVPEPTTLPSLFCGMLVMLIRNRLATS